MKSEQGNASRLESPQLSWVPLFAGAVNSYGPVAFNYGFALYFLNYRHGFVKRGLIGEMLVNLRYVPRWHLLAIEYLFLAAAFAMTYWVFRKILFGTTGERRLAAALLSAPALLPHLGYLFAQPDVLLYILLLGCLWSFLRFDAGSAAATSCVLCCVALLGHEAFSLMFYPLIAGVLLHLCLRGRLPWYAAALHILVVLAVFVAILHLGKLKISPDALLAEAASRTNVGIQRQVYDVMASSLPEQRALVRRMYTSGVWKVFALTVVLSAPYITLLARLLGTAMRAAGCRSWQRKITMALLSAPILLCVLGHDTTRWIGAMCINATLLVLFLYLTEPAGGPTRRALLKWAEGPTYTAWLAYLLLIGPYGATGLRAADQIVSAVFGP